MHKLRTQQEIRRLANKYNLPAALVDDIVRSQFLFLTKLMKEADYDTGHFESLQMKKIGKFLVTTERQAKIKESREAKKAKQQNDGIS